MGLTGPLALEKVGGHLTAAIQDWISQQNRLLSGPPAWPFPSLGSVPHRSYQGRVPCSLQGSKPLDWRNVLSTALHTAGAQLMFDQQDFQ